MSVRKKLAATPTLGDLGENSLIDGIQVWLNRGTQTTDDVPIWARAKTLEGIGSDCAIIEPAGGGIRLALTTDMLVEGRHFLPDHPAESLGVKAANANLSDLAAAGAWPSWILVSLSAPASTPVGWFERFYDGLNQTIRPHGCKCLGGDCVGGDKLAINIVAGGFCQPGAALPLRSRARAGQGVYVTGELGDSAAGLELLSQSEKQKRGTVLGGSQLRLMKVHQEGRARVALGLALAEFLDDIAMMDLSDGLASDLPRMVKQSEVGFQIELNRLPMSPDMRRALPTLDHPFEHYALFGGEDYELVFCTARPEEEWRDKVMKAAGGQVPITRIGEATPYREIKWVDKDGEAVYPTGEGFRHF